MTDQWLDRCEHWLPQSNAERFNPDVMAQKLAAAEARIAELEAALREISDYRKLPLVDAADPSEDRERDWAHAARRCWDRAARAIERRGEE